tara:strand:- start:18 stop:212 length:195 start_codon:yes stop_codon:yes gene_type:complete
MNLAYCDMMAYSIKENLEKNTDGFFKSGPVQFDLADKGYMQSTTKFIEVVDENGKKYKITIEEV